MKKNSLLLSDIFAEKLQSLSSQVKDPEVLRALVLDRSVEHYSNISDRL
ncbi:MAG: hypothetical protein GXP45_05640 [bacterium]|nr:hypothetical protein [bacterium]